jgi:type IV pilus assembly protein PilV
MKHNQPMRTLNRQAGFSLLEVLITIIVVTVGLLGVAGLQVSAIKLADIAESRTRGSIYVDDIMARMRANKPNALAYDTSGYTSVTTDNTLPKDDIVAWRNEIRTRLPDGEGAIEVTRIGGDCSGNTGAVALADHCSAFEAVVRIRWNESRARGGDDKREFFASTRI